MKLIYTNDGEHYRRWINLIPSLFFPGSAQFLAGRRTAALAWFVSYMLLGVLLLCYWVHPKTNVSILAMGPSELLFCPLLLAIAIDGFRRPIRCLHLKGWTFFFLLWLCLLILPMFAIRQFLAQPFRVSTRTMQPTIMGIHQDLNGNKNISDHVFVNKLIYRFSAPRRGDVIVFKTRGIKSPLLVDRKSVFIKRLVGLPGEKISINPPNIVINGITLTNPPIFQKISEGKDGYGGYVLARPGSAVLQSPSDTITLGPDEYLLFGDNSPISLDGRHYGPIKRKAIIGKAFYIYAPADRKRKIE
ncbi:signal peptidase I [Verrucomicrobiota bacterium]